jgi:uncharacterized protein YndB with AHSA1/START domain
MARDSLQSRGKGALSYVTEYRLASIWQLIAPIESVWDAIYDSRAWPEWWPYVASVVEVEAGDVTGLGAVRRYTWTSRLPYRLTFELEATRVERPFRLEGRTRGDLKGHGSWHLQTVEGATRVRYDWIVTTTRPWMNLLAPLAQSIFTWNHHAVMRAGGRGLARRLNARLIYAGPERR